VVIVLVAGVVDVLGTGVVDVLGAGVVDVLGAEVGGGVLEQLLCGGVVDAGVVGEVVLQVSSSVVGHVASVLLLISTCETCRFASLAPSSSPPTLNVYGPE
jgi:hypothetical protein